MIASVPLRFACVAVLAIAAAARSAPVAAAPTAAPAPEATAPPAALPLFDDLGSHRHPVSTRSPQAQAYFDQGMRLLHASNQDGAIASFRQASRLDPNCAMAWWGIAFALGPSHDLPADAGRSAEAMQALQRAIDLSPKASPQERDYIAALQLRHSTAPNADPAQLDRAFADAMRVLAKKYPDDTDAGTLFAESLLVVHRDDLWAADGTPRPGTGDIVSTLEAVLAKDPDHPGANHLYLLAIEGSPEPARALPAAERLPPLMPGAGHLVQAPARIYMRLGDYAEASAASRAGVEADARYLAATDTAGDYRLLYVPSHLYALSAAAAMAGNSAEAIDAGRRASAFASPARMREMPRLEYYAPALVSALARFGRWDEILRQPAPPDDFPYAKALWSFARGLAFAATGRAAEAGAELAALGAAAAAMPPDRVVGFDAPARTILLLAQHNLAGEIAARQGKTDEAVSELRQAIELQDGLPNAQPPLWYYPVRQSLGAVLLAAERPRDAGDAYRDDLKRNPNNGWSLLGLARSLHEEGNRIGGFHVRRRFEKAWRNADVAIETSRF